MSIIFELSPNEQLDRQLEAIYDNGFGAAILAKLLPKVEALAKENYLTIADSEQAGSRDPRLGIESGAMFQDLTTPVLRNNQIILDTSLDYALEQEQRLQATSGRSFLPSEDEVFNLIRNTITELF